MANSNETATEQPAEVGTSVTPGESSAKQGWLAALRSRLGLGAQQTLRETLEEAVRSESASDAPAPK